MARRWRKVAGVEPTGKRLTSPPGFEAGPHHRMRMPSVFADDPVAAVGSILVVPTAVDTQHPRIACAPSIANAVEELQNPHRTLAPDPDASFGALRHRKENPPIQAHLRCCRSRRNARHCFAIRVRLRETHSI